MQRRTLLKASALLSAIPTLSFRSLASENKSKTLLLVELAGGNDSLNMVCPIYEKEYARARPTLGLKENEHLPFVSENASSPALSFHKAFEKIAPLYKSQELGVLLGVGYENPDRSHFRSSDIWQSARFRDTQEGWVKRVLQKEKGRKLNGLVIGKGGMGCLAGLPRSLVVENRGSLRVRKSDARKNLSALSPALQHVYNIDAELFENAKALQKRLRETSFKARFPKSPLGNALKQCAHVLVAGVNVPIMRVQHGGFDTHKDQKNKHARLLMQLSEALFAFRGALKDAGLWRNVVVMTTSEFGRRVAQNSSGGCDHGAAASHLVMGGAIKGGLYGTMPSLSDLNRGDLKHTTDFRSIFAGAALDLWGAHGEQVAKAFANAPALSLLA